jgi:hypothetical protein
MAKSNELRVKIVEIGEVQTVGSNGFTKREVEGVVEGEYPENYQFEFQKDKTALADGLIEGTYVTIHYNLRSRKVTHNKNNEPLEKPAFYVTLVAWKVES